ncbi:MAG: hypothetical protein KJ638_06965, partial [Chloroflexi bacterium]|nr:hypothetical protein [Chloroflexota bacterium]
WRVASDGWRVTGGGWRVNVIKSSHRRIIAQHPLAGRIRLEHVRKSCLLLSDPSHKGMLRDDPTDTKP